MFDPKVTKTVTETRPNGNKMTPNVAEWEQKGDTIGTKMGQ